MWTCFFSAYMSPDKTTPMIDINVFGEANFELGLILFSFPFVGYAILHVRNILMDMRRDIRKERQAFLDMEGEHETA